MRFEDVPDDVLELLAAMLRVPGLPVQKDIARAIGADQALASLIHDARFRARSGHLLRLAVLRGRPASLAFVSPHSD